jgi:hypothetical protein
MGSGVVGGVAGGHQVTAAAVPGQRARWLRLPLAPTSNRLSAPTSPPPRHDPGCTPPMFPIPTARPRPPTCARLIMYTTMPSNRDSSTISTQKLRLDRIWRCGTDVRRRETHCQCRCCGAGTQTTFTPISTGARRTA